MIVQPDFPEHWKTRRLVAITKDESAPLAVIRLWSHCQSSKRSNFPEMTSEQLASICRWEKRKPACHVAMVKAGFVDKLSPKGYAAHQWSEYNSKLFANWENGLLGGRPPKNKNPNENDENKKPVGSVGLTQPKPIEKTNLIDQIDLNNPTRGDASPFAALRVNSSGAGMDALNSESGIGGNGLVDGLLSKRVIPFSTPTKEQVRNCLRNTFAGADRFTNAFFKRMTEQHWRYKDGGQITNWQSVAKAYASTCALNSTKR